MIYLITPESNNVYNSNHSLVFNLWKRDVKKLSITFTVQIKCAIILNLQSIKMVNNQIYTFQEK